MKKRITINMLSSADKVDGQGVGSAYLEQVALVKDGARDYFSVRVNSRDKADIIHCHTIDPINYLKMKMNKGVNVSYVHFLPHTLDGSIKLPKISFKIFKNYVIEFYKTADHVVVVNPIFKKELAQYGIEDEKIHYIPNYVSREKFHKLTDKQVSALKRKYSIDPNKFVVLGVGQVQTRKGVLDFIKTAKKLPDVQFVWCGSFSFGCITDGYEELKKVYDNPPENVKFLGIIPRDEMNNMYNIADVLFMPSYNELFPMAILEAINSSKPLLLRDLDLYEDILFNKYIKGKSVSDFADAIKKLSTDKKFYKEQSKMSDEISNYYSKEHVLQMWIDFYTKIYEDRVEK